MSRQTFPSRKLNLRRGICARLRHALPSGLAGKADDRAELSLHVETLCNLVASWSLAPPQRGRIAVY
jgi:hypothetical protein